MQSTLKEKKDTITPIKGLRYGRLLEYVSRLNTRQTILDIGCQSGDLCTHLERLGHEPHGIEILTESVEAARAKYPSIDFRLADCEREIPYESNTFDLVWAGEVIEHIGHTGVFISEINRVLKPRGQLVLTTPLHALIKNVYIALFRFEKHFDPEFSHYRFYTKRTLCKALEKRGFKVLQVRYIGRIPIVANCMWVVAEKDASPRAFH
jgi:2-polyprenyl-3-methyl-5-hydroxy-6-metoxy-1,4-benzoquinol methylase